jgi:hypothetical protein
VSPIERQEDIEQRMDEAFSAGPGSKEEQALSALLSEHPEYQALWKEYQNLRQGMDILQTNSVPSELTGARIRHAARGRLKKAVPNRRGWRWLLSQPLVAAATVLLVVGFGFYSQYLWRESKKTELPTQKLPVQEEPSPPTPSQGSAATEKFKLEWEAPPPPKPAPTNALAPQSSQPIALPKITAPTTPTGAGGAGLAEPSVPADEAVQRQAPELKAQRVSPKSPYDVLLSEAKDKITAQDCPAALKLLAEAQKIKNTDEVKKLMAQCHTK